MRRIFIFPSVIVWAVFVLAAISLTACTPSVQSPAGPPRIAIAPFAGDGVTALAKAGRADAPTYEQILGLFGAADVSTREGQGGLLSYRLPACALALGFAKDQAGALRLAAVEAGPLTPRDAKPSLADCAAQAGARRKNEAIS